jgi:hypothetical protein
MPAGAVEHEDDDALVACSRLFGEERKQRLEKWFGNAVVHIPENLAGRGRDEGGDIEPFKTMMAMSDGPLADRRPDATRHRLQAEAMLIRREDFDGFLGVFGRFFRSDFDEFFLNPAASSGVADLGFFGRGFWIDQPHAFRASHPRCVATLARPSSLAIQLAA